MSALARNIAALICALALVLVPVVGSVKGGGGLINLPGGGALNSTSGLGNGAGPIVRPISQNLTLVLRPTMRGAIVVASIPGTVARVVSATTNGRYTVTKTMLTALSKAGVEVLRLDFVAPNLTEVRVELTFLKGGRVSVQVK